MMLRRCPGYRLGWRGTVRRGELVGRGVFADVCGMMPVDSVLVLVSPELDVREHPEEIVQWVDPQDLPTWFRQVRVRWEREDDVLAAVVQERFL